MNNNQYPNQSTETTVAVPSANTEPVVYQPQPQYIQQPVYAQQPVYTQPTGKVARPNPALSIISLVCGICAIVFCYIPFIGLGCGIAAIITAAIARKKAGNGMNKAGLICGIIGTVLSAILTLSVGVACIEEMGYDSIYDYDYYYTATNWDYID